MLSPLFGSRGAKPHQFATTKEKNQIEKFLNDIPNKLQEKPQEDAKIYLYDISLEGRIYNRDAVFVSQSSIHLLQKRFESMGFDVSLKEKYDSSWTALCCCKGPERYTLKVSVPLEEERTVSHIPVSVNPEEDLPLINANIPSLRQRKKEYFQQEAIKDQKHEEAWKAFLLKNQEKFATKVREQMSLFASDVKQFEIPITKMGIGPRGSMDVASPIAKELTATGKWSVSFKEVDGHSYPKSPTVHLVLTRKS